MSAPFLSVVTPSYNQARFLEDNFRSVLEQANGDVEHIVVDGGSDDGTLDVLRRYEDEYDLRWVSEPDRGQSHALNKGIEMADGEWIGWQNSDDYYLDGAFDELRRTVAERPDADVVYGDLLFVDADGETLERKYHTRPSKLVNKYGPIFAGNQCTFFRASAFDELGPVDESLDVMMESELFVRVLEHDLTCAHVPRFLGAFRQHEAQKTHGVSDVEWEERESVFAARGLARYVPRGALVASGMALRVLYLFLDGASRSEAPSVRRSIEAGTYEVRRLANQLAEVVRGNHPLFGPGEDA